MPLTRRGALKLLTGGAGLAAVGGGGVLWWRKTRRPPRAEPPRLMVSARPPLIGDGHYGGLATAAFSPDGRWLASGSWDRRLCIWDVAAGRLRARLGVDLGPSGPTAHTDAIMSLAWAADGRRLVTGSWDGSARIWHLEKDNSAQTAAHTLIGHGGEWVNGVAWSPTAEVVATAGCDRTVVLWSARDGSRLRTLTGAEHWVMSVAFSPDGATVLAGARDGSVRAWAAATGEALSVWGSRDEPAHGGWVAQVGYLAGRAFSAGLDGRVRLWSALGEVEADWLAQPEGVNAVAVAADSPLREGPILLTVGDELVVRMWDREGAPLAAPRVQASAIKCVAATADGRRLATGGWDNALRLFDVGVAS